MNRRQLVIALGSILATSIAPAWPQPTSKPRVVWFSGASKRVGGEMLDAFLDGFRTLGYQQDRDFVLESHWADFSAERISKLAAEIAVSRPTVVVATGAAIFAAVAIDPPLPVVFVMSGNPVDAGIADSFSRPGRNATGVSLMAIDLTEKRLDILKKMVPRMRRVAFLANPEHTGEYRERRASQAAADKLRLDYTYFQARSAEELKRALAAIADAKPDALIVFGDGLALQERQTIADVMRKSRIPVASGWPEFAESGFLMTYGPDRRKAWAQLAYPVDRIIKGAKPADVAIQLPAVFDLVVNENTAKELNLVIPKSVRFEATRVVD